LRRSSELELAALFLRDALVGVAHVVFADAHAALDAKVQHLRVEQLAANFLTVLTSTEAVFLRFLEQLLDADVVLLGDAVERRVDFLARDRDVALGGLAPLQLFVYQALDELPIQLGQSRVARGTFGHAAVNLHLERARAIEQLAEQDRPIAHDGHDALDDRGLCRTHQRRREGQRHDGGDGEGTDEQAAPAKWRRRGYGHVNYLRM
jgi:hypothetical protein